MPAFITGARGHDFGRRTPCDLLSAIGQAGFACTQLAYTKAVEGVKSYSDVTPELVAATQEAVAQTGVRIAVYGTYVELGLVGEEKRKAEAAKVLSQIGNAKLLAAGCMGSETTPMEKQPGANRKDALEALLRSLGVSDQEISRSLFWQTLLFFGAPLALACIHSLFGLPFCGVLLLAFGVGSMQNALIPTALLLVAIYGGYFLVTYLCGRSMIMEQGTHHE